MGSELGRPQRLDQRLVAMGLAPTRARAQALIAGGHVRVDGAPARKPAQSVAASAAIAVEDAPRAWVSRGALKLIGALDHFALSPAGLNCLDLGASTGGFTEALLDRGAVSVAAVDVGRGQLAATLRDDPRVHDLSPLDARALTLAALPAGRPDFVTADLSFIGFAKAAGPALALAAPGATLIALIKPQFEVGPAAVGKGGVVRDAGAQATAVAEARDAITGLGWRVLGETESPITGGDGNREWLLAARKSTD